MDIYDYIASSSPLVAKQIINSFGYKVVDSDNMAGNLRELVAQQGEEALKLILNNHPDKDIILELFETKPTDIKPKECGCDSCSHISQKYLNANGEQQNQLTSSKVDTNFSLVFLAGIMVLSVAIISKQ